MEIRPALASLEPQGTGKDDPQTSVTRDARVFQAGSAGSSDIPSVPKYGVSWVSRLGIVIMVWGIYFIFGYLGYQLPC